MPRTGANMPILHRRAMRSKRFLQGVKRQRIDGTVDVHLRTSREFRGCTSIDLVAQSSSPLQEDDRISDRGHILSQAAIHISKCELERITRECRRDSSWYCQRRAERIARGCRSCTYQNQSMYSKRCTGHPEGCLSRTRKAQHMRQWT